jgi:hypothetical protein
LMRQLTHGGTEVAISTDLGGTWRVEQLPG